jgi:hypothetical protein
LRCPRGIAEAGIISVRASLVLRSYPSSNYDVDVGASQLIIDGKIKIKNDSQIAEFTETGLKFENGSELPADVVVFATGYVCTLIHATFSQTTYMFSGSETPATACARSVVMPWVTSASRFGGSTQRARSTVCGAIWACLGCGT